MSSSPQTPANPIRRRRPLRHAVRLVLLIPLLAAVMVVHSAIFTTLEPTSAAMPASPAPATALVPVPVPASSAITPTPGSMPTITISTSPAPNPATTPPGAVSVDDPVVVAAFHPPAPVELSLGDLCDGLVAGLPVPPAPGWRVECHPWKPNSAGQTDPYTGTISIYAAANDDDVWLRRVLAHEIGHSYDFAVLSWSDRHQWEQARGFAAEWYSTCVCSDLDHGSGDFAESFMYTFLPAARPYFSSRLAGPPTAAQQDLLRAMIG